MAVLLIVLPGTLVAVLTVESYHALTVSLPATPLTFVNGPVLVVHSPPATSLPSKPFSLVELLVWVELGAIAMLQIALPAPTVLFSGILVVIDAGESPQSASLTFLPIAGVNSASLLPRVRSLTCSSGKSATLEMIFHMLDEYIIL